MRLTRVYVEEPLACGTACLLRGSAANHVTRVLRLKEGDMLTLFDGRGGEYIAQIQERRANAMLAEVQEHRPIERESRLELTLAQGISRGERMDLVVQKATELGVRRIVPVLAARSVVRLDERQEQKKLAHWRAIAVAACEQSGRNRVPEVTAAATLNELLATLSPDSTRVLLSPTGTLSARDLAPLAGPLTVLIGPEGGLTDAEQEAAVSAGFMRMRLGPRVLRTETAALAALAALQHDFGDL